MLSLTIPALLLVLVVWKAFSVRRSRRQERAEHCLVVGRRVVGWLNYWFFTGISPHLDRELFFWSEYAATTKDKGGKRYKDVIVVNAAYNSENIRFDVRPVARRQTEYVVRTVFPQSVVQLRFREATPEELEEMRRVFMSSDTVSPNAQTPAVSSKKRLNRNRKRHEEMKVVFALFGNLGGTMGKDIGEKHDPKDVPHAHLAIFDLDSRRSAKIFSSGTGHLEEWKKNNERFFRPEELGGGLGAGGDHEVATAALEEIKDQILERIEGADMVVAAACPSGGSGGGIQYFAELVTGAGIPLTCHLVRPFGDEGDTSTARFLAVYSALQQMEGVCLIDHHNEYAFDPSNPLASEFKKTSRMLQVLNEKAIGPSFDGTTDLIMQIPDVIGCDLFDVLSVAANSKRGYSYKLNIAGFRTGDEGEFDVDKIINQLLNDRFQRPDVIVGAKRAFVLYPDELPPLSQRRISDAIMAKMRNGEKVDIDFRRGVTSSNETDIIIFVGTDIPDSAPNIRPPWMLETAATAAAAASVDTATPLAAASLPEKKEPTETVDIALPTPPNTIQIVKVDLPLPLARDITSFSSRFGQLEKEIVDRNLAPEELKSANEKLLKQKGSEWSKLRMSTRPHLPKEMADLLPVRFTNSAGEQITRRFTPLIGYSLRDFIAKCTRNEFATVDAAQAAFNSISAAVFSETAQILDPSTSKHVQQALGIPVPTVNPPKTGLAGLLSTIGGGQKEERPRV